MALTIQITHVIGLKPVCQDAKQEMAWQVNWRSPPEHRMPASPKLIDVEVTQARNFDVERLSVLWCKTDLYTWHRGQRDRRFDWPGPGFPLSPPETR